MTKDTEKRMKIYDVIVIGAGTSGGMAARALSRYKLNIAIIEKTADAGGGTSKANSGIVHGGYDAEPGTLKALLNQRGNAMMDAVCWDLDVNFKRNGSMVVAFDEADLKTLDALYARGNANNIPGLSIIDHVKAKNLEPNLSDDVIGALLCESAGVVNPYELAVGAVENAVMNGADVFFDTEVTGIKPEKDLIAVVTQKGEFAARYLVNAAGVYGGVVAEMYGEKVQITPRKGEYLLYDQAVSQVVSRTIFQTPSRMGKGVLVTPTVEGNLLLGPTSENIESKDDFSTTRSGLSAVLETAKKSVPDLTLSGVITSFAGLRAVPQGGDFIIRVSETNPQIIDCIGIESPGLSSSPAIGEYVLALLQKAGLKTEANEKYKSKNKKRLRFSTLNDEQRAEAIAQNPKYGHIVCRCETVTEGEIIDAIHRPAGATTVDGVKHRTRAGAGRCHGGFCGPAVMQILSRELDDPMEKIRRTDDGSWIVNKKTKA